MSRRGYYIHIFFIYVPLKILTRVFSCTFDCCALLVSGGGGECVLAFRRSCVYMQYYIIWYCCCCYCISSIADVSALLPYGNGSLSGMLWHSFAQTHDVRYARKRRPRDQVYRTVSMDEHQQQLECQSWKNIRCICDAFEFHGYTVNCSQKTLILQSIAILPLASSVFVHLDLLIQFYSHLFAFSFSLVTCDAFCVSGCRMISLHRINGVECMCHSLRNTEKICWFHVMHRW